LHSHEPQDLDSQEDEPLALDRLQRALSPTSPLLTPGVPPSVPPDEIPIGGPSLTSTPQTIGEPILPDPGREISLNQQAQEIVAQRSGATRTREERRADWLQRQEEFSFEDMLEAERRKQNPFKKVMGSNYNPLKHAWNGLEWWDHNVADPLSGLAVGGISIYERFLKKQLMKFPGVSEGVANFTLNAMNPLFLFGTEASADLYIESLKNRSDATSGLWKTLGDFNRERDASFVMEKLLTSIIVDPTSYIGLGLATKIPKVGKTGVRITAKIPGIDISLRTGQILRRAKDGSLRGADGKFMTAKAKLDTSFELSLGAAEAGFNEFFAVPFRMGAKLYRKLPRTVLSTARSISDMTYNRSHTALTDITGKEWGDITYVEKTDAVAKALDLNIAYKDLPSDGHRVLRDEIFEVEPLKPVVLTQLGERIARAGTGGNVERATEIAENLRDVVKTTTRGGPVLDIELSLQDSFLETIQRHLRNVFTGRMSQHEAADEMLRLLEVPPTQIAYEDMRMWIREAHEAHILEFKTATLSMNKDSFANYLSERSRKFWRDRLRVEKAEKRKGMIGALQNNIDQKTTQLYQNGLRRWVNSPLAKGILMFPLFPIQEVLETTSRQFFGNADVGWTSAAQFDSMLGTYDNIPRSIADLDTQATSRLLRAEPRDAYTGSDSTANSFLKKQSPGLRKTNLLKARIVLEGQEFNMLDPRNLVNITGAIAGAARRKALVSRSYIRQTQMLADEFPELAAVIDQAFPDVAIHSPKVREGIMQAMVLRVGSGDPRFVRALPNSFSPQFLHADELFDKIDPYRGMLANNQTEEVAAFIRNKPNLQRMQQLEDDLIAMGWNNYKNGGDGAVALMEMMTELVDATTADFAASVAKNGGIATKQDLQKAAYSIYHATQSLHDADTKISGMLREVQSRISGMKSVEKEAEWLATDGAVESMVLSLGPEMERMSAAIRNLEITAYDQSFVADSFMEEWAVVASSWTKDRAFVRNHFDTTRVARDQRGDSFWNELRAGRDGIWNSYSQERFKVRIAREPLENELRKAAGMPDISFARPKPHNFRNARLSAADLGYILGAQGDNVGQGLLNGAFFTEEEFVNYVMHRAKKYKLSGVDPNEVGRARELLLSSAGLQNKIQTGFAAQELQIKNMIADLGTAVKSPSFTHDQHLALNAYAEEVARAMEGRIGNTSRKLVRTKESMVDWDDVLKNEIPTAQSPVATRLARPLPAGTTLPLAPELDNVFGSLMTSFGSSGGVNMSEFVEVLQKITKTGSEGKRTRFKELFHVMRENMVSMSETTKIENALSKASVAKINRDLKEVLKEIDEFTQKGLDLRGIPKEGEFIVFRGGPREVGTFGVSAQTPAKSLPVSFARGTALSIGQGRPGRAYIVTRKDVISDIDALQSAYRGKPYGEEEIRINVKALAEAEQKKRIAATDSFKDPETQALFGDYKVDNTAKVQVLKDKMVKVKTEVKEIQDNLSVLRSEWRVRDSKVLDMVDDYFRRNIEMPLEVGAEYDELINQIDALDSLITRGEGEVNKLQQQLSDIRIQEATLASEDWLVRSTHGLEHIRFEDTVTPTRGAVQDQKKLDNLGVRGQEEVDGALEDVKQMFVNYDDSVFVDDFMQSIFPFWKYESRRLPYLLRTGFQKPAIWQSIMPEGRYWDATDEGYVPVSMVPWMDLNLLGGTMFNTPRRMFRASYPPKEDQGFQGLTASAQEEIARFGFYFGPHVSLLNEVVLPMMGHGERDEVEFVPPFITGPLGVLESTASSRMPGLQNFGKAVQDMRRAMMPDRFREFFVARILTEKGHAIHELDFDTMRPRPGANTLTQEEIDDAVSLAALQEWMGDMAGNIRFEGPARKQFEEARDLITTQLTGLDRDTIQAARRDGVSPVRLVPLPPYTRRLLQEIPNAEGFGIASSRLRGGERKEAEEHVNQFWRTIDDERERHFENQQEDDARWGNGDMSPSAWYKQMIARAGKLGTLIDSKRGRERNQVTGEMEVVRPEDEFVDVPITYQERLVWNKRFGNDSLAILHPLDELLQDYFGKIIPKDRDGDGEIEWDVFFKERKAFEDRIPIELRDKFFAELDRNATRNIALLRELQRGKLGAYWEITEDVKTRLGAENIVADVIRAQKRGDTVLAKALRAHPLYRRFIKEVDQRKDIARRLDPEVDYALAIFGLTGESITFRNPIAQRWWVNDAFTPDISHFSSVDLLRSERDSDLTGEIPASQDLQNVLQ
jgi:hypothetical protein